MKHRSGRTGRISLGGILFLLAAAGAACSLLPAPREAARNTFLLHPEPSPSDAAPARCDARSATLLVNVPREEPGFDTPRMAYLPRPNVVNYYANSQWADTPARMLVSPLVNALESAGCRRAVVRAPGTIPADFRLDTEDLVLGQEFFSRPSRVRLAVRAILVDVGGQSVVAARRFEVLEDAPSEDAQGGAVAANRSAARLLGSLAIWTEESLDRYGSRSAPPARP